MYAYVTVKAKVNWRGDTKGCCGHIAATQAEQALSEQRGCLCTPLIRRQARRVVEVGRGHSTPTGMSKQGQCAPAVTSLYRNAA
jgi:hypothetical protein